jgi:hypothetical protein
MGRPDYKWCRSCGKHASEVGELSHTRLCVRCARARIEHNYDGLTEHTGPFFRHWRTRIAASVGGVLIDDLTASQ